MIEQTFWKTYSADSRTEDAVSLPPTEYRSHISQVSEHRFNLHLSTLQQQQEDFCATARTAWAVLLHRYTESDEELFGVSQWGRALEKSNTPLELRVTPYRVAINAEASLLTLRQKIQKEVGILNSNQPLCPCCVRRDSHECAAHLNFQTILSTSSGTDPEVIEDLWQYTSRCFLEVKCVVNEGSVATNFHFDPNILDVSQVVRVAHQLEHVLRQVIASTDITLVKDIEVASQKDLEDILQWQDSEPHTVSQCIHTIIYNKVRAQPHAEAVCGWDVSYNYTELDDLAARFAAYMIREGLRPGDWVPFCLDKSANTVIAMLAILKAGGACVALHPEYPAKRIASIIEETGAKLVIIEDKYSVKFSGLVDNIMKIGAAMLAELPRDNSHFRSPTISPEDPAYIAFTSGSTGKPKGIVVPHRAVASGAMGLKGHGATLNFSAKTRALQFSAYTFDVSIAEIFYTLMFGGCVCVPSEDERLNDLEGAMNRLRVNWACLTPTVSRLLTPTNLPYLKTLTLGGEALSRLELDMWTDRVCLNNGYGPAECTIWCTIASRVNKSSLPSNIGRGVGAITWVTEPGNYEQLCPVGCIGELLIQGPLLSHGYLNDEQKTMSAFIENPKWMKVTPGQNIRLYKTGDLVRYNLDGSLTYIGRKDSQIKLSGIRIELEEVEHALLSQLPAMIEAAVEVIGLPQTTRQILTAFLCIPGVPYQQSSDPTLLHATDEFLALVEGLKLSVRELLPVYMVPTKFLSLSVMPKTVSGKIDRRTLRSLAFTNTVEPNMLTNGHREMQNGDLNDKESTIKDLWANILGISRDMIGKDDNFFHLGGDSVLAIRLVSAARHRHISLKVRDIFSHPQLQSMVKIGELVSQQLEITTDPLPFELLRDSHFPSIDHVKHKLGTLLNIDTEQIHDAYQCTPLQEALMAVTARDPGAYDIYQVFKILPGIDISRFIAAWNLVVKQIPILRTQIVYVDGIGACQVVLNREVIWTVSISLQSHLQDETASPMSYCGDLNRFAIVEEPSSEDRYFVWTIHHAVCDGYTVPLVLDIFKEAYSVMDLKEIPPYARYIHYLQSCDKNAAAAYWTKYLAGAAMPDFPQPHSTEHQARADQSFHYSTGIVRNSNLHVTMATLIRAAWAIIVGAYAGTSDIIFGMTQTGRHVPVPEIENIIGPTIATVPVRINLDKGSSVHDFLQLVQDEALDSMKYEHLGLQGISHLSIEARTACNFQTLIVVQTNNATDTEETGLNLQPVTQPGKTCEFHPYSIVLESSVTDGSVNLDIQYDRQALTDRQAQRLVYQMAHVLSQLCSSTQGLKLEQVELVSPQDKVQLASWNTSLPAKSDQCVHWVIKDRILQQPNAEAICSWDASLTYAELDSYSTKLSVKLMDAGVGQEVIVPLIFEKSAWAVVSLLAVLKAGGAFLFLDPAHPVNRLAQVMEELQVSTTLSSVKHVDLARKLTDTVVVVNQTMLDNMDEVSQHRSSKVLPSNAAYMIYTSGTTGRPKGTIIEHSAFCTSAENHKGPMRYFPSNRAFQFASYTFDASLCEMLTSLMCGACLCIPSEHQRQNDIVGAMNAMRVNWAILTPSVSRLVDPGSVPTLKYLILAGEAMSGSDIERWTPYVNLINGFGPTETSVVCSVNSEILEPKDVGNIGHAVGGLQWVVDTSNPKRLAPIGAVGELLVEGYTLARGYFRNQEKTSAVFIEKPRWLQDFSSSREGRMYMTGDQVKYNDDGTLQYMGRKDTRVKVNGQLLELGDIEHHLSDVVEDRQVTVILPKRGVLGNRLVAVISERNPVTSTSFNGQIEMSLSTSQRAVELKLAEIRDFLSNRIPSFMVPTNWILINSIPLRPSGKADKTAVTTWVENMPESLYFTTIEHDHLDIVSVRTRAESKLQGFLAVILHLPAERISMNRSFISLGGDSIRAIQLMSVCRDQGMDIEVHEVLGSRTIGELANKIRIKRQDHDGTDGIYQARPVLTQYQRDRIIQGKNPSKRGLVMPENVDIICPSSPIQRYMLDNHRYDEDVFETSLIFEAFDLQSSTEYSYIEQAWRQIVNRHSIPRTVFVEDPDDSSGFYQLVLKEYTPKVLHQRCKQVECLASSLKTGPKFSISTEPPHRLTAYQTDGERTCFKFDFHHAIIDGVSLDIIFRDFGLAFCQQPLRPIACDYHQFTTAVMTSSSSATTKEFWNNYLKDARPCRLRQAFSLEEPDERPSKRLHSFKINMSITQDVVRLCEKLRVTKANVFRAAWALVLRKICCSNDICFGYLTSGRDIASLAMNEVVGPCISTLVCRVAIPEGSTTPLASVLQQVQEDSVRTLVHQHGYLSGLTTNRGLSSPLFDTLMNFRTHLKPEGLDGYGIGFKHLASYDPWNYGLVIAIAEEDGNIDFSFDYWSSSFSEKQVSRLAKEFSKILRCMVQDPMLSITDLS
ncbi:hypothetical protein F5884DRAFT_836290 [Xylogone sp. PMI_703]|nr:hypothetical protein F5884DRAFT_836290 [Xylogone sp. PMI_703]